MLFPIAILADGFNLRAQKQRITPQVMTLMMNRKYSLKPERRLFYILSFRFSVFLLLLTHQYFHQLIVSVIRSRAMEKLKRKPSSLSLTDSFSWVYSGDLYITQKGVQKKQDNHEDDVDDEKEEFLSVASCFSCCSSSAAASRDVFLSVKTSLSRCSSLNGFEFNDFQKRQSIIQQLCHCKGWPFGLCRKAVLLPPLPKSPSESWSWHKGHESRSKSLPPKSHSKLNHQI